MYNIAVIPGDGIGREVMDACIKVLDSLDIDFNFTYGEAGDECLEKNGEALPDETIELAKNADACLFGAAGETAADVIVRLRQELNLFANLRPVKSYPNTNALFDNLDNISVTFSDVLRTIDGLAPVREILIKSSDIINNYNSALNKSTKY